MTWASALAASGGVCAVLATWELLAVVERTRVVAAISGLVQPLRARRQRPATAPELRRLGVVAACTMFAGGWLLAGPPIGVLLAAGGPWLPAKVIAWRRRRWRAALACGSAVSARSIADALAGGHSVRGAIAEAARAGGAGPETDQELRAVAASLSLGATTEAVLLGLRERAGSPAWDTLVAGILMQRDAGGDLAALLRELAGELDASRRVEAEASAATAQARFTGWIVMVLPLVGAVLTELGSPGTLAKIAGQPLALVMAGAAAVLQVAGIVVIRRLAA